VWDQIGEPWEIALRKRKRKTGGLQVDSSDRQGVVQVGSIYGSDSVTAE